MTAIARILRTLSRGMELRPLTPSIPKPMTLGMERTLTRKTMWIRVRALFRIGIFWLKNSLWRLRNLVCLSFLYHPPGLTGIFVLRQSFYLGQLSTYPPPFRNKDKK